MTTTRSRTIALMLESDGPGGAEVFLLNSALELRRRGHRVVTVLPARGVGWLGRRLDEHGLDHLPFTHERPLDLGLIRQLGDHFRRERVDVVHSHEFTLGVYGAAVCKLKRLRHVLTLHGNQWIMGSSRNRVALKWACRASHAVVAVSEDTRRHLLSSMRMRDDEIVTIPNGVPEPRGDPEGPRREFGLADDDVVLLAVGNLSERKGHIVLLQALDLLVREGCRVPWKLIVAGEGEERARLQELVDRAGLGARVHLPGHRSDVPDLQAAAHVLVMPSLWEGLPLAVLEGMHAGNAIIGSRTSGIPEAVRDGVDGLLVAPGDVPALAAAVRRLLENPEERAAMGAAALARAESDFSIGRMMDRYEELYWGHEA